LREWKEISRTSLKS